MGGRGGGTDYTPLPPPPICLQVAIRTLHFLQLGLLSKHLSAGSARAFSILCQFLKCASGVSTRLSFESPVGPD